MSDETVPPGELVLTSGGDGIFPKGLLVGRVTKVTPSAELFLNIRVRPAADLSKLEEVLVVTKIDERQAQPDNTGAGRAVDILAERLPGVPSKPENAEKGPAAPLPGPGTASRGPASPGPDAKPKAAPPQASVSAAPVPRSAAAAASSEGTGSPSAPATTTTDAVKISPKPVKTAVAPNPQPTAEDRPH
jgi:rod shape-determining protein MreC